MMAGLSRGFLRQGHGERGSPSRPALDLNRAAVRFGDPLADGEAEPRSRTLAGTRARRIRPPETIEDVRQVARRDARSEEHTSELQSRGHLVCRLLLEKKK